MQKGMVDVSDPVKKKLNEAYNKNKAGVEQAFRLHLNEDGQITEEKFKSALYRSNMGLSH